jgi:hypothetical protein
MVQTHRSDLFKVFSGDKGVPVCAEGGGGNGTVLIRSEGPFVDDGGVEGIEEPGGDERFCVGPWVVISA